VVADAPDPSSTLFSQLDTTVVPLEELNIELLLQCADVAADGRFVHLECSRNTSHAAQFSRCKNIFQKAKGIECHNISAN
jgi:hypothetical protein